ncbi:hypothetical protein [Actinobacillus delphinicola]|uniref:Uncharacterized protein n=1 Tax=Actinobacillus delphinicola TaxID=51161 RepID=A0A448TUZ1_9PAST|nr:hypothetical protein [Actinobacillus delphinicola]VEJ09751.1 Uncharacterised protein [Actinobacillus delphinicola]
MAYQTGNAQNIHQLLEKLAEFAKILQWEIVHHTETKLYLRNKDGHCFALEFLSNVFYTIPCTQLNNDKSAIEQLGSPCLEGNCYKQIYTRTTDLNLGNFIGYDFFGTADYLHVVVEIKPEQFRHFGIGMLLKEAEFMGGQYAFGTYLYDQDEAKSNSRLNNYGFSANDDLTATAVVRADKFSAAQKSPWYLYSANCYSTVYDYAKCVGSACYALGRSAMPEDYRTYHPDNYLVRYSQSQFGNTLIPAPNSIIGHKLDNTLIRLGILPDRYECTMQGIPPKKILEINGERWKIIPSAGYNEYNSTRKTSNPDNTGIQGVAYRIIDDETVGV